MRNFELGWLKRFLRKLLILGGFTPFFHFFIFQGFLLREVKGWGGCVDDL
jgi:hypothetical protein